MKLHRIKSLKYWSLAKEAAFLNDQKLTCPTIVFFEDYSIMSLSNLYENDNLEQICIIFTNQILMLILRSLNILSKCQRLSSLRLLYSTLADQKRIWRESIFLNSHSTNWMSWRTFNLLLPKFDQSYANKYPWCWSTLHLPATEFPQLQLHSPLIQY
jgi:hypothetical protein